MNLGNRLDLWVRMRDRVLNPLREALKEEAGKLLIPKRRNHVGNN